MADVNNPIKYSDLIVPDDALTKLIAQLDQVSDAYNNLANNIKSEAGRLSSSLQSMTGATEEGRNAIRKASSDADALAKAQQKLAQAMSPVAVEIAKVKEEIREQNQLNRIAAKEANAAAGSYNALSAQYSRMKTIINSWDEATRKANADYIKGAEQVYEKMKQMQAETGKMTLNVGNYEGAAQGLRTELRNLTQQMAAMQLAGQKDSKEYAQLAAKAGQLRDAMNDASQAVNRMASDTGQLDVAMSALTATSGGFTALLGAMNLFGGETQEVQQAQKTLQATMSITMGLTQLQNALQKQSALMLAATRLQTYALAKAEAYERLIKIKGNQATIQATIAQKAFNLVAKANPYVLIATALISVVGALYMFSKGTKAAAEEQEKLNKLQNDYLDYLERINELEQNASKQRQHAISVEISLAKSRGASTKEVRELEDKLNKERQQAAQAQAKNYATQIANIQNYTNNIRIANEQILELSKRGKNAKVTITIDGKKSKLKVDEAIKALQDYIDTQQKNLKIGLDAQQEMQDAQAEAQEQAAQRAQEDAARAREARKNEISALQEAENAKLAVIKNSYDRQTQEIITRTNQQIAQLRERLRTEENLTATARNAINAQIIAIEKKRDQDLDKLRAEQRENEQQAYNETTAMRISLMREGFQKEMAELDAEYNQREDELRKKAQDSNNYTLEERRQFNEQLLLLEEQRTQDEAMLQAKWAAIQKRVAMDATETRLEATREGSEEELALRLQLIEQQRDAELQMNRSAIEEMRIDEMDINAKYDALALRERAKFAKQSIDLWADMMKSEVDLMRTTSNKKEAISLEIEAQRLKKIIDLIESGSIEASTEELTTYKNQYEKTARDAEAMLKLGTKLSTGDDLKQGLQDAANYTIEILSSVTQARVQMAEAAVAAADKEVEAAQKTLDTEREAAANGYANNQEMAQKEFELAKENQRKALDQQKKAQKQQQVIDTLSQISSLVTASASMWKDLGFPMALVGIATMWASFAASKIMAAKLAKQNTEQYGEGTIELLQGGSHASGNDIDLGRKPDGTRRRAEGGEYFAIINKRNSRRYRRQIPDIINSLNDGSFARKYVNAYDAANGNGVGMNITMASPTDVSVLEGEVRKIREQGEKRTYMDASGSMVTTYRNVTRRIRR